MRLRWLILAGLLAAVGCGHRGRPIPPLPRVPLSPAKVDWHQRGDQLEILASYELKRRGGGELQGHIRPSILVFAAPNAEMTRGWESHSRDREYLRLAKTYPLPDFAEPQRGQRVTRRDRWPISQLGKGEAFVLSLVLEDARGRSVPSRRRTLVPARPDLPILEGVSVNAEEARIRLSWVPPSDARASKVRIYRRVFSDGTPSAARDTPWLTLATVDAARGETIDAQLCYGHIAEYAFATTMPSAGIPVESLLVKPEPLVYRDVFPPLAVQDLEAVAEGGRIRVLWFSGGSPDEALAVVERQQEGQSTWVERARVKVPDADLVDDRLRPGVRYRYRVTSVDREGNRSETVGPSRWVAARTDGGHPRGIVRDE